MMTTKRRYLLWTLPVLVAGTFLTLSRCTHQHQAASPAAVGGEEINFTLPSTGINLVYQMGRNGMIDPCGCTSSPDGGLDRELNLLNRLRAAGATLYVDGGDMYAPIIAAKGMTPQLYRERANALTDVLNDLQLEVFSPGPGDIALGQAFLKDQKSKAKFQWVATNLVDKKGKHLFEPLVRVEKNGMKFAFLGITPPKMKGTTVPDGMKLLDVKKTLTEWVPKAKEGSDYVVVFSQYGNTKADQAMLKQFPDVNLMVGNDITVTRKDGVLVTPKQLLLDPHHSGFMTGALQIEHRSPFKGWFSPRIAARNKEMLKGYKTSYESLEEGEQKNIMKQRIDLFIANEPMEETEGFTHYLNRIIPLDPKNFGEKNAISTKVEAEKKRVADQAIQQPAKK